MRIRVLLLLAAVVCSGFKLRAETHRSVAEQYLLAAANAERGERGLPALRWDDTLYFAAHEHAMEMAARRSISHQYPGEPELASRGKQAGAHFSMIAENVAEAPTAVRIHDAWMNSPGHRSNLLDPKLDSIAISVVQRGGELYAVQDFDRSVVRLSLDDQENEVASLVSQVGQVEILPSSEAARETCAMQTGYAGSRQPWFVMRFTAGDLNRLPDTLVTRLNTGRYHRAAVAACSVASKEPFTAFHIAVLLYP